MIAPDEWLLLVAGLCGLIARTCSVFVETSNGKIEGTTEYAGSDINVFWGIPFAKPPVGDLRFRKPEPPDSWTGTRQARVKPNSCHQVLDEMFGRFEGVEMWNANTNMSEDCLYLNVWAPATGTNMPVLVWIFGGGFWGGSSSLDVYDGRYLAAQNDVIVVSMNYRLGPLGYLYLNMEEAPGNLGMFDQQLALKWVHDNIDEFGGDNNKVTIFGESAGAASVTHHILSPGSWDYFQNSAILSASSLAWWAYQTKETALERSHQLAKNLKCDMTSKLSRLKCLKETSAAELTLAQWNLISYYFDPPFSPIVDGDFLPDVPETLMRAGQFKNGSLISGVVKDEGMFWLLYGLPDYFNFNNTKNTPLTTPRTLDLISKVIAPYSGALVNTTYHEYSSTFPVPTGRDIADDISGDLLFKCSVKKFANYYSQAGNNVYMYSFEHDTTGNPWPKWMGVLHGYEIDHFFGLPFNYQLNYLQQERDLSGTIMTYLSNLARTGDVNKQSESDRSSVSWPPYTTDTEAYLRLNTPSSSVDYGLRHRPCLYWWNVAPQLKSLQGSRNPDSCQTSSSSRSLQSVPVILVILMSSIIFT